ncbi:uncharacterized protein LOC124154997 [Ischnura elegans]|uniref:uncharacterized protein LOC124154997 n=1 Tax=Ischnura elegans TaxID=197161 RepID=UPI001ED8B9F9|nr:uncharacterized protein LOC124154997 [Ischnura elegans]
MGALKGPFGLAGRMNGLGLRLAMKDATADDVFNFIAREMHAVAMEKAMSGGLEGHAMVLERVLEMGLGMRFRNKRDNTPIPSVSIDCPRLFPRCTPLEAPDVIIKMVLGDGS